MSIRIGMASVGRLCLAGSGLCESLPPGVFSQATAPHMLPLHWATRMLATPSATFQSPEGSAASAEVTPVAKNNPEKTILRARVLGQCNMVQTYAYVDGPKRGSKRRIERFQLTKWPSTDACNES